ncbi:MAG TPA: carboxypeptidase-like regulatory domain-containing protein, partial [Candidatus Magasanikbacteria bacterium]|nr:carboxypeptidase-like regulatory domain-containing protein [Candidatus Magasanikbacteria bacterium]
SRSNIDFVITRTVRNIDDPFDGTIDGEPKDLAPADYKLFEAEIICTGCDQRNPIRLSTQIAPKYLEGSSENGALFIEVFDAEVKPVSGATVRVVATSTVPSIDITDTTDNDGMLRIVDLPPGVGVYSIIVSKDGYTTDQTVISSDTNPNPVKTPVSVMKQDVTEISFSIDRVAEIQVATMNNACQPIGNVGAHILGTKLLGVEPNVFKVDDDFTTNGSGEHTFSNMEWDAYGIKVSGRDLLGSIPVLPINLVAGSNQPVTLILGTDTINSLLVNVTDGITSQPLSSARVELIPETGGTIVRDTGVGYLRQTDWSGGAGQLLFTDETKYYSDDSYVDVDSTPGDITLEKIGKNYLSSGELISSVFDLGTVVRPIALVWEPLGQIDGSGTSSVRFQIAVSDTSTPTVWQYTGPDGTDASYFVNDNFSIPESVGSHQYFRYKLYLSTDTNTSTPVLSDLTMSYTTSCTPPGQAYFGGLSVANYTVRVSREGYQPVEETVSVSGDMLLSVSMSVE